MTKTIGVAETDHKRLKMMAVNAGTSIMNVVTQLIDDSKELKILKSSKGKKDD